MIANISLVDFKPLLEDEDDTIIDIEDCTWVYIYELVLNWGDGEIQYVPFESEKSWEEMDTKEKKEMLQDLFTEAIYDQS